MTHQYGSRLEREGLTMPKVKVTKAEVSKEHIYDRRVDAGSCEKRHTIIPASLAYKTGLGIDADKDHQVSYTDNYTCTSDEARPLIRWVD